MPVVVLARPRLLPLGRAWGGRALGCDGCCGVGGCCCGTGAGCSSPACRARTCPGGAELSSGPAAAPAWSCQCRVWLPKVLRTELVPGSPALPKHPRVLGEAAAGAGCGGRVLVPPLGGTLCWLKQGAAGTRILGMLTSRRPLPLLPPSSPFPIAAAPSSGSRPLPAAGLILLTPFPRWGVLGGLSCCSQEPCRAGCRHLQEGPHPDPNAFTSTWHLQTPTRAPAAGPVQPLGSPQTPRAAPRGFSPSILPWAACWGGWGLQPPTPDPG